MSSESQQRSVTDKIVQPLKDFVGQTKQTQDAPQDESTRGSQKTIPDNEQVGDDTIATELNGARPNIVN
ncbi:hypothetical protein PYCC9005_001275 [Savitreella phatthalungensis]